VEAPFAKVAEGKKSFGEKRERGTPEKRASLFFVGPVALQQAKRFGGTVTSSAGENVINCLAPTNSVPKVLIEM
jgi:hypothetical protein